MNSFWLVDRPQRLLLVSTGNIINRDLESLIDHHLSEITDGFATSRFLELNRSGLTTHV